FPIRVELKALTEADFVRILQEPRNALIRQYQALVASEDVELEFDDEAIREIARIAAEVNERMENIGARRLHTVMTTLLEELLFELPDSGQSHVRVDAAMVRLRLREVLEDDDLRKYIL
ncbi:MAG: HslU--HslV peptidase ATPase subunit, partial [Gemmatimonadetes bacterium]|nr:HslU--HslV peptidase ATPase subunit [Gemmatimonadota bacterium]NIU74316.1 HslU--HslV peptidase ATPase subunit [Gammaproteobacteria bacterium]NIP79404.1 HslU--HslV peptidase ATPase subunit [Gemmatimonadota bacterium]NIQ54118.1 HslU--HslV peptidase ATPase subunit [Gemmatimonadota bacterium]NIX44321.1 HslU--HslV peptidase ATPase subunit [Gemmatimonadota bacterium]